MPASTAMPGAIPPADALLDALPDGAAILDRAGTIVAVNQAWRMFALDNGGSPDSTGVGTNYLAVCRRAAAAGCTDAAEVSDGINEVLGGGVVERELDYPCPSPAVARWFTLRITRIDGPEPSLLVSHVNISRRKAAERVLEKRASEDPLTGLANRARLLERLKSALTLRAGRAAHADVGVLFLDLDMFKPINDTYGHAAGDEVLRVVAHRLRQLARPQDTIARVGGDEFAILAPRISHDGLDGLVERIRTAIAEPHVVHGDTLRVGASVGTYLATKGEVPTDCLAHADEAMYADKARRRGDNPPTR